MKIFSSNHTLHLLAIATLLATLQGCATTPPGPKPYEVRADADPVINRDIAGKPLSVVVRLYQLKGEKEFDLLTFDLATSNRSDAELFGDSLIQRSELLLVPGTTHISTETLLPETKYLGIVAYFRRPDAHSWRYLVDAQQVRTKGLSFRVLDCYLKLQEIPVVAIPGQALDAKPVCLEEHIASPRGTTTTNPNTNPPPRPTVSRPPQHPAGNIPRRPVRAPAVTNPAPVGRVGRPITPLPTPPAPTSTGTAVTLPPVNINVTPNLGLPKWGVQ